MTLRELKTRLEKIDLNSLAFSFNGNDTAGNLNEFRRSMTALLSLGLFEELRPKIEDSFVFQSHGNVIHANAEMLLQQLTLAEEVKNTARALLSVLSQLAPDPDANTVSIKLPPSKDLAAVIGWLQSIQKAIAPNVLPREIGGKVEVTSWQPGSLWLDICLGSMPAVAVVGSMAWAAAVVNKKWHEGRIVQKIADSMDIKNEGLKSVVEAIDAHVKLTIEAEAKNLFMHNYDTGNPEQIERLKLGIKEFTAILEKGGEVHPALTAPEEVKNLFPDLKNLLGIESKQKLLGEHGTENKSE